MKSDITYIKISYIVMVLIILSLNLQTVQSNQARKSHHRIRSLSEIISKIEEESIRKTKAVSTSTPESKTEIVKEMEKLIETVKDKSCDGKNCDKLQNENFIRKKENIYKDWLLKPAYTCEEWDDVSRICSLHRNLGNTVTFVLGIPPPIATGKIRVEWHQRFETIDPKINKTYDINPNDPPWNMVIGSRGHELRLSPVTETDVHPNRFTAVVHYEIGKPTRKLSFRIKKIPVFVGIVYPGATMTLHVSSFITLPTEGMSFKWILDRRWGTLPSNMRPSKSGATLRISELRKEQEGVVACSVYTNLGVQATRLEFRIQEVNKDHNKLVFVATRPPHSLYHIPKTMDFLLEKLKRDINGTSKRKLGILSDFINKLEQRALKQRLSKIRNFKQPFIRNINTNGNRRKRSLKLGVSPDYFTDSVDSEQANINLNTDFYFKEERKPSLKPRYLNKRQDGEDLLPPMDFNVDSDALEDSSVESRTHLNSAPQKRESYFGNFDEYGNVVEEEMDYETLKPTKRLSFLERRRLEFLERASEREQGKKLKKKKLRTTTESFETLFDVEEGSPPLQESDKLAMLLAKCNKDMECSSNAMCVQRRPGRPGFCRCLPTFEGNGIFCWEGDKWMI